MTRRPHDQYFTPASACEVLVKHWDNWEPKIFQNHPCGYREKEILFEPCFGQGDIARAFFNIHKHRWLANDIDESMPGCMYHYDLTKEVNWKWILSESPQPLVTISNPPFNCAIDIVKNAVKYSRATAMLLRLSFLEPTRERGPWLAENPPDLVIVLPRISFTGDGKTDSVTCAWMIWDKTIDRKGVIVSPRP